jgi:hypothetical protein
MKLLEKEWNISVTSEYDLLKPSVLVGGTSN